MNVELSQLLINIRNKSNITVDNVGDLKLLEEDINIVSGASISFNTLRRLYGFLPQTKVSKKTLDSLARYLGFSSYSNYLNKKNIYDRWYYRMKLLKMSNENLQLSSADIDSFHFNLKNNINVIMISDYIGELIKSKKKEDLIAFFKQLDHTKLSDSTKLKFAIIITHAFYKLTDKAIINLYKSLIHLDGFRNCIPLYSIDYSHLNGYYGNVLLLIQTLNKNNSEVLFTKLMLYLKHYYSNKFYQIKKIELPNNYMSFHPVLIGRYFGYLILLKQKLSKTIENNINKLLTKLDPKLLLIEIVPALIIKEEFEYLDTILNEYYEDIFTRDRWTADGQGFNYLIGLANVNIYKNNLRLAKINLNLIDLEKIELGYTDYISLFYYLTLLKIAHIEKDENGIIQNYSELKLIANKTGFQRFIEEADKYKNL
jgi:hypothetical protein